MRSVVSGSPRPIVPTAWPTFRRRSGHGSKCWPRSCATFSQKYPAEDDQFILTVTTGTQPRLWIDMTAFIAVGRDRRTYRFLKDTRLGRTVILESPSLDDVADTVTNYVAERIIERERVLEADWLSKRIRQGPKRRLETIAGRQPIVEIGRRRWLNRRAAGWIVAGFLAGVLIGAVALLAYAWVRVPI